MIIAGNGGFYEARKGLQVFPDFVGYGTEIALFAGFFIGIVQQLLDAERLF